MRKLIFIGGAILITGIMPFSAYGGVSYGGVSVPKRGPSEEKSARISKSTTLNKAEQAFIKGDYEEATILGNRYSAYRTESYDELQYLMGRALLKLNRFDEARNRFLRVINDSKSDEFLDEAYIGLADSYYLESDYKEAKEHYEKIIRYFPDSDDMPIVYYRLGECYSKLGNGSASKECYDKLIKFYPDSLETKLLVGEKSKFVTYSVQVGSFKSWKNAKKLCDELKSEGFDANISAVILENARFYRVRVGRYDRLGDAEDTARALQNRGYAVEICP